MRPRLVISEEELAAASYQPMTLLRIRATKSWAGMVPPPIPPPISPISVSTVPAWTERLRPRLVISEEELAAASYQPMTLLRIRACPRVVVVLPAEGAHSVHRESSEGCMGSPKFHTDITN